MTIGEFSRQTGISCSTLRYYEDKGLIRVSRDLGNRRDYSEEDIEWVKFLQRLKSTGMSLEDIRRYSALRYQGESTMAERLAILYRHKQYVTEQRAKWEEFAQNLERKISFYETAFGETLP